MTDVKLFITVVLMLALFQWGAQGEDFTSGSTGADGDLIFDVSNGTTQEFDHLANDHNGIWNFNAITIPSGVTVTFPTPYANGTPPVVWLATGDIVISGILDLNGKNGRSGGVSIGSEASGGPGGYAGGVSAPGDGYGPGGGEGVRGFAKRTLTGSNGAFANHYGNRFLQPLLGGSGGGGTHNTNRNGALASGGGGGGAILLASSTHIQLNGTIRCNGGSGGFHKPDFLSARGGHGSGGGIRLISARISGTGSLSASPNGRIVIEAAHILQMALSTNPFTDYFNSAPTTPFSPATPEPTIAIVNIAGNGVALPALGRTNIPEVFFANSGPVTMTLECAGIPLGETITVAVKSTAPNAASVSGQSGPLTGTVEQSTATIELTVPAGRGVIHAYSSFSL